MRANTHVSLVVDNTAPQTQRSKCATPPQSFLTDQHPIYGGKAEVVRTQQSGGYWHFRMWISEERKYVRKTLKTTHLDTAVERAENEFFAIKANVNAGRRIFSPTVQQAEDEYLAHRWNVDVKRGSITEGRWATFNAPRRSMKPHSPLNVPNWMNRAIEASITGRLLPWRPQIRKWLKA